MKIPRIPHFARGLLVGLLLGILFSRPRHHDFEEWLFYACLVIMVIMTALEGFCDAKASKLIRSLPFLAAIIANLFCFGLMVRGLLELHELMFIEAYSKCASLLSAPTLYFALFLAARSFLRSRKPYPSLCIAFGLWLTLSWVVPYSFLMSTSVEVTGLVVYAALLARMVMADLLSIGVDIGGTASSLSQPLPPNPTHD